MAQILDKLSRLAIPIGFALAVGQASIYDVRGGYRGKKSFWIENTDEAAVLFDRFVGIKKEVIGEGTHFLIPWLQRAIIYDVRTKVFFSCVFSSFFKPS